MKWNQSEITYCLDNVCELSFTVEMENMYLLLLLLLKPLLLSPSNVFAPLATVFSSGQPTLWVRFLHLRLLPGFMQIYTYITSSFVSLSYLSSKAGRCGTLGPNRDGYSIEYFFEATRP